MSKINRQRLYELEQVVNLLVNKKKYSQEWTTRYVSASEESQRMLLHEWFSVMNDEMSQEEHGSEIPIVPLIEKIIEKTLLEKKIEEENM